MNRSRARAVLTALTVVAAFFVMAASASADVTPKIDVQLSNTQLGAHADTTVRLDFDYGGVYPAQYPAPSDYRESVKNMVVDIPPGLIGNPNAIPISERCDPEVFETSICPDSATVGTFTVDIGLQQSPPSGPTSKPLHIVPITTTGTGGMATKLSLIKTDPDVPATIGIYIHPPLGLWTDIRQKIQITPDVNTDLKLRTITLDPIAHILNDIDPPNDFVADLTINWMSIKFFGTLPNGNAFMTNPTECTAWSSTVYASAHYFNTNVDSDPLGTGANQYRRADSLPITPDCSNLGDLPFPISGTTKISTKARDVSPEFDFTITEPGLEQNGQVSTSPKKIVTTVPASINVDVQQLGRLCESAAFNADTCPESTRVGTVAIETPLIANGLTGDVYLVRSATNVLPDLGMHIRGAIHFTQRGTNRYVGDKGNQIQTTFDNIPAVGFSRLNVHLFGGPNGLLRSLKCPTSNKQPVDGNFSYNFTAYSGATAASTTDLSGTPCFGIQKLRTFKCVYKLLRFQPTYTSRARVKKVVLYVDGKKIATVNKGKFQFRVAAKKFKKGKHKFELRATYDDGTVSKKQSRFRRC